MSERRDKRDKIYKILFYEKGVKEKFMKWFNKKKKYKNVN